jgi:hypothetical protein
MDTIDVTYGKATKIWWSYCWRACILMLPVMLLVSVVAFAMLPFPKPGQTAVFAPEDMPSLAGKMGIVWIFLMALNIFLQVQAMKWMLKTKWQDFQLHAVPRSGKSV